MPRAIVTRRVHFNAAHRLHNPSLSDAENRRVFGPCNNPHYHGHNYELEISVEGEIDTQTGFVADLGLVKTVVEREVVDYLDHRNLNVEIAEFKALNPTAENIAVVIWRRLEGHVPGRLARVTLWETPRNYVIYEGR
jgi:6-pyruvoyltetrahydropterin/6-carboxytetrahydropterin synthase